MTNIQKKLVRILKSSQKQHQTKLKIWTDMYAFSADTFTIRQKGIRKAASRQEHHLKNSLKTGYVQPVE